MVLQGVLNIQVIVVEIVLSIVVVEKNIICEEKGSQGRFPEDIIIELSLLLEKLNHFMIAVKIMV